MVMLDSLAIGRPAQKRQAGVSELGGKGWAKVGSQRKLNQEEEQYEIQSNRFGKDRIHSVPPVRLGRNAERDHRVNPGLRTNTGSEASRHARGPAF